MNYHFLPRIKGLAGEVTLANFPPNDGLRAMPGTQIVHVTWSDGARWQVRDLGDVAPGQTLVVGEAMLPHGIDDDAQVFLFLYPDRLAATLDAAITSNHLDTSPAWRGNIRLRSATTSVSYQGEYPSGMVAVPTGSMVSIGPMIQDGGDVTTKFLLFNMRQSPVIETRPIRVVRLSDRRVLRQGEARYNRMSTLSLAGLDLADGDLAGIMADTINGIPLYFSHDTDFRHMCLEHTHPPAELAIFGDRFAVQRAIKRSWLAAPAKPDAAS